MKKNVVADFNSPVVTAILTKLESHSDAAYAVVIGIKFIVLTDQIVTGLYVLSIIC